MTAPAVPPEGPRTRLRMSGIGKRFGATVALEAVDLSVDAGEVVALVGENGAGKSTLMKVLAGALAPDAGRMWLDGATFRPADPHAARAAGVTMIYQEANVAPDLSVEANLQLGVEPHRLGVIRRGASAGRIAGVLERLGRPDIRPSARVGALSAADRQIVEIARALLVEVRVLVLDEPTSSLGLTEIARLFEVIEGLRRQGVAIIYISHFLEEVQRVADRFVVLRDGRVTASGRPRDVSIEDLVERMIGRRLPEMFPSSARAPGEPVLELDRVVGAVQPRGATLDLRRGEVLGLAGLVGAGRTELLRAVFGLDPVVSGRVRVAGSAAGKPRPPERLAAGVGLLSEDRQGEGLALARSVIDNMLLSRLGPFARWGWLDVRAMRRAVESWVARLDIRVADVRQATRALSGGNQQKVALARLLHHDVDVLLLDEPTRGIDVASKAQVYTLIDNLASQGKAILLVSDYIPELLGICDRIAVMHRGQVTQVRSTTDWTEHEIMIAATSGSRSAA